MNTTHTMGPWCWEVTPNGDVRLVTPDRGKLYVMGFERKGMQGATPRFSVWKGEDRARQPAAQLALTDEQAKNAIGDILHPFLDLGAHGAPDWAIVLAHALEHPERHGLPGAQPAHGPVVAWRYVRPDGIAYKWNEGAPSDEDRRQMVVGEKMQCVSDPATVPAEVMVPSGLIDALQRQRQVDEDGTECGVSREAVHVAIEILKSLQGAGHGQG